MRSGQDRGEPSVVKSAPGIFLPSPPRLLGRPADQAFRGDVLQRRLAGGDSPLQIPQLAPVVVPGSPDLLEGVASILVEEGLVNLCMTQNQSAGLMLLRPAQRTSTRAHV